MPNARYGCGVGETIQSVERAAAILRLLASGSRQLGVAELATAMGLPKGTLHGILRTLVHVGFVEQDRASGKYRWVPRCSPWAAVTLTSTSCGHGR